ncbi:UDP-2,3-diacylglucosamine diphosphatase [Marinomonas balearica]|uniref:UDP-2,3-diacylglucosamine hydrolase n=1 Tax=Marinomonas balearica TaxID=491947 RepID=A0A4R6ME13_9GAMM|nr:UDP-2,3-diacylglucosamine diphosphatase [Marinomonas balearica]TDP00009.1 UDP-2,3-diacylglucosamine hydrolase [Marinomonas balearica]
MPCFFISDLHLYDKRPDLIRAFIVLTDEIKKSPPSTLYILGDFYEAWIGDDYQPEWNKAIENALHSLIQSGHKVNFTHGNRDFLVKQMWSQRTGVHLLDELTLLEHNDLCLLLAHGDEFCIDDVEYQAFRSTARTEKWQESILAMPIEQRIAFAQKLRNDSKSMSADKDISIMDVNPSAIETAITDQNASILIHGHTHRPKLHQHPFGKRLVLGDWDEFVWIAKLDDNDSLTQSCAKVDVFCNEGMNALTVQHSCDFYSA